MKATLRRHSASGLLRVLAVTAALLVVAAWLALAPRALSATTAGGAAAASQTEPKPTMSATLEQCVTAPEQSERSATFSGEMLAIPGTAKMQMRIDVLERQPREAAFHTITAAGLGVWRTAAPGVKTYKYLKQVTNLAAPAYYRAAIRFRWLNAHGRLLKSSELRTPRCLQTLPPAEEPLTGQGQTKTV